VISASGGVGDERLSAFRIGFRRKSTFKVANRRIYERGNMKVLIEKVEGHPPRVKVHAEWETVTSPVAIDEWIKNLQLAKAWLKQRQTNK
jgi:hypothetical protein